METSWRRDTKHNGYAESFAFFVNVLPPPPTIFVCRAIKTNECARTRVPRLDRLIDRGAAQNRRKERNDRRWSNVRLLVTGTDESNYNLIITTFIIADVIRGMAGWRGES